jgi:SET domain-containing protein
MTNNYASISLDIVDVPKFLPKILEINYSKIENAGLGIFAKQKIEKNSFLGNYMGEIKHTSVLQNNMYEFTTIINGETVIIDALNTNTSNWTRYMNCAMNESDENVACIRYINPTPDTTHKYNNIVFNLDGYLFFYAKKDIEIGDELVYNYGEIYKKFLLKQNDN